MRGHALEDGRQDGKYPRAGVLQQHIHLEQPVANVSQQCKLHHTQSAVVQ